MIRGLRNHIAWLIALLTTRATYIRPVGETLSGF